MIKVRLFLFFTIIIFCFASCAKKGYITGGDIDTIPPVLISSNPKNMSLNFNKKEFKLHFDEFVKLKNINKNLIISPPMEEMPIITPIGGSSKTVTIKIKDTLKANTTYSFNFGESIVDNNEGNVLPQLKYIFSTGDYIDSLKIKGNIHSVHQLKTDNYVNVMLYDATTFNDSTVYKEKPIYITNTLDSLTTFTIDNVKEGLYYLIALKDKNNNYKFDPSQDKIAFLENPITIPTDQEFDLNLFKSEVEFKVNRPTQISENKWYLPYRGNVDSINIVVSDYEQKIPSTYSYLMGKDSLQIWFSKIEADSLLFEIENCEYRESFKVRPRPKMRSVDTLRISSKQGSILDFRDEFKILSSTPIILIDSLKISIQDKDSLPVVFRYINELKEGSFELSFEKKELDSYNIRLLPGAITDFFGQSNDSIFFNVRTKAKTDYGNLTVKLQNVKRFPVILEVLDSRENVMASAYSEKETSLDFQLLPPKKYLLRLIYDDNENGKWDSGNYLESIQPEEVIYYPEEIDLRANWDMEQIFQL